MISHYHIFLLDTHDASHRLWSQETRVFLRPPISSAEQCVLTWLASSFCFVSCRVVSCRVEDFWINNDDDEGMGEILAAGCLFRRPQKRKFKTIFNGEHPETWEGEAKRYFFGTAFSVMMTNDEGVQK
jgi:hypothetical protein